MARRGNQVTHRDHPQNQPPTVHAHVGYSEHHVINWQLPPAAELERLEALQPGSTERLFAIREQEIRLLEEQVQHRQHLENKVISADVVNARWGMVSSNIWIGAALGTACYLALHGGHDWLAGAIVTTFVATVLAAFITNTVSKRKERSDRLEWFGKQNPQ